MRSLVGIAVAAVPIVAALSAAGPAIPRPVPVPPTLAVVVVGGGAVTSSPAGISCPGKCAATFAPGTIVVLTPKSKRGSFLRWGGSCAGGGACKVRVSALSAVAAQFAAGGSPTPTPRATAAEPGSYSLFNAYRTFFVALGGRSIVNIAVAGVPITCVPAASGAPANDYVVIPRAAIRPDGSFAASGSQRGLFAGVPATYTYSFAGRLTPASGNQRAGATGSFREDIAFKDSVSHRCTSNTQSWTAVKVGPIPQQTSLAQPGKYSLFNAYRTFSVAPGARSMVNVAIGSIPLICAPAASNAPSSDQVVISQVAIRPDGSFAGKSSQDGTFAGSPAKFVYSFAGNFQGLDANGRATAAGTLREDITFTDSAGSHSCTSNTQTWTAVRIS